MEWPTSSKLSVASLPACSSKTSSPPGCWKRRLKVSKSTSAKEVSRVSAAFLALFIPYEWNQHQRYLPKIQSSSLSFRKSQRTMHAAQLGNTLHKIKIFSKRQISNVHTAQLIPLQQNQPFCNSATDLGKKIIQKKAYPFHCPHCTKPDSLAEEPLLHYFFWRTFQRQLKSQWSTRQCCIHRHQWRKWCSTSSDLTKNQQPLCVAVQWKVEKNKGKEQWHKKLQL